MSETRDGQRCYDTSNPVVRLEIASPEGDDMSDTCKWSKNGFHFEDHDYYETGCDNMFQFSDGGLKENHFEWCPYCGGLIEVTE